MNILNKRGKSTLAAMSAMLLFGLSAGCSKTVSVCPVNEKDGKIIIGTQGIPSGKYNVHIKSTDGREDRYPSIDRTISGFELPNDDNSIEIPALPYGTIFDVRFFEENKSYIEDTTGLIKLIQDQPNNIEKEGIVSLLQDRVSVNHPSFSRSYVHKQNDVDSGYMKALVGTVIGRVGGQEDLYAIAGVTLFPLGQIVTKNAGLNYFWENLGFDIGTAEPISESEVEGDTYYTGVSLALYSKTVGFTIGIIHHKSKEASTFKQSFSGGIQITPITILGNGKK